MANISESQLERQSRQVMHWGKENQERLYTSSALILGGDILGQMTLGALTGLGVGNILIMDNSRSSTDSQDFMFPRLPYSGIRKIDRIERIARAINPGLNIRGIHSKISKPILGLLGYVPNVIIDVQNNRQLKEQSLEYALSIGSGYISAYCDRIKSATSLLSKDRNNTDEILDSSYFFRNDLSQGSIPAGVSAGIIADEFRKYFFSLDETEKPLEERAIYNPESFFRNGIGSDIALNLKSGKNAKVLVAGSGAIGNYVGLNLSISEFKEIELLDNDLIEQTNLARQILFYGEIGKEKAVVLARRLREFSSSQTTANVRKLDEDSRELFERNRFDIVFGCFDNQEARFNLSSLAMEFGVPYIDGGTTPSSGAISIYYPGKTGCIKCKKELKKLPHRNSCMNALPSVVIPSIAIGSMMVGEALHVLNRTFIDKRICFDTTEKERVFVSEENPSKKDCPCNFNNKGERMKWPPE